MSFNFLFLPALLLVKRAPTQAEIDAVTEKVLQAELAAQPGSELVAGLASFILILIVAGLALLYIAAPLMLYRIASRIDDTNALLQQLLEQNKQAKFQHSTRPPSPDQSSPDPTMRAAQIGAFETPVFQLLR